MFIFGTLMDPHVREAVLGRNPAGLNLEAGRLEGWRLAHVAGRAYPMLIPHPTGRVEGILLHGLTDEDRRRLDYYEGDEYVCVELEIAAAGESRRRAQVYACRHGVSPGRDGWRLVEWQRRHKPAALARIRALMAGYGRI
ncbi:MAG: gamma-glutamylcyclotransferase [Magnetospirillum sp.]|nr:gamma-glutamylcyclotransferase [Magnetospirillum sp.]